MRLETRAVLLRSLACACLAFTACARAVPAETVAEGDALGPGPMLPPAAIGEEFLWRQRVTATWDDGSESFDAVLQVHQGRLTLMGLGPMGRPGFIATLTDSGVTFENRTGRTLPFAPEHILGDVQRAYYPWLARPAPGFTGARTGRYQVLTISETYERGRLRSRSFTRSDAPDRGVLRVQYGDWGDDLSAARRVILDNAWFGYRLTILTVDQERLGDPATASAESGR